MRDRHDAIQCRVRPALELDEREILVDATLGRVASLFS